MTQITIAEDKLHYNDVNKKVLLRQCFGPKSNWILNCLILTHLYTADLSGYYKCQIPGP